MIAASSLPIGVKVELSRAALIAGTHPIVDDWMTMLNERLDGSVDTLCRERMALEPADHIRNALVAWATEGRTA